MNDYLPWILGLLGLGMMAYPIIQFMPSDRQKLQIKLRQQAYEKGLQVKLKSIDLPKELKDSYRNLDACVAYHLSAPSVFTKTHTALRSNNDTTQWFWVGQRPKPALMQQLLDEYEKLPIVIKAVQHNAAGHSLFWQEQVDVMSIDEVASTLARLDKLFSTN